MKYKAYFSDNMTHVEKAMENMSKAASFGSYRKWDIRGNLDDVKLACDRDTDDAEYWDIIFANIKSPGSRGNFTCYERTVTYWNYIVFFLEDGRIINVETRKPGALQKLRELLYDKVEEVITFADEDTFVI